MFAQRVTSRLRTVRRAQRLRQQAVAEALGLTISAVSRLERGMRGLRTDQLAPWAAALGYRVELLLWRPALAPEEGPLPSEPDDGLDDRQLEVLAQVAAALPHMPRPASEALAHEMKLWVNEAVKAADAPH